MKKNAWKALVLSAYLFLIGGAKVASNIEAKNKKNSKIPTEVVTAYDDSTTTPTVVVSVDENEYSQISPSANAVYINDEDTANICQESMDEIHENKITAVANEVINGKWGYDEERRKLLELNGYDYYEVMNKVNELLGSDFRYDGPINKAEKIFYNPFAFINTSTHLFDEDNNGICELEKYEKIIINGTSDNGKINVSLSDGAKGFVLSDYLTELPGTYIEVDISEQKLYMYINNDLIFTADVITGNPSLGTTPGTNLGYTEIYEKLYQTFLIGPTWKSYVDIFMRFNDSAEGFHDADGWRSDSEYGDNTRYLTNGSHGCVNMKQSDAETLDSYAEVGTKVLVHK